MYVSTGGSDSNIGTTSGTALATIQEAVSRIKDLYDMSGFAPVIKIDDGSYLGWQDYGQMIGRHKLGGGPILYLGNTAHPENVVIYNGTGVNTVSLDGGAQAVIVGMELQANASSALYLTNSAIAEVGIVNFTGPTGILADGYGRAFVTSTIKFKGSMTYGMMANKIALIEAVPGVQIAFDSCSFGQQWLFAANGSTIIVPYRPSTLPAPDGVNFVGTFSGQKAFASLHSIVNSGYGTYDSYPGTINCGSNAGGVLN
jgi:hypothetical protein